MPHESHRVRDQQGGLEYRTGYDGVWLWDTAPVLSPQASTCPGPANVDKQHHHVKDRETELGAGQSSPDPQSCLELVF